MPRLLRLDHNRQFDRATVDALDTDPACRFVREALLHVASERLRPLRH